jgi:hypothetical protein
LYPAEQLDRVAPLNAIKDHLLAKIAQKLNKIKEQALPRRPYTTPHLREFGPVGTLTQAGTGAKSEGGKWACTPRGQASKMC